MSLPGVSGNVGSVPPPQSTIAGDVGSDTEGEIASPPHEVGNPEEFKDKYGGTGQPNLRILAGGPGADSPPNAGGCDTKVMVPYPKYDPSTMSAAGTKARVTFCGDKQKAIAILAGKDLPALEKLSAKTVAESAKLVDGVLTFQTMADRENNIRITIQAKVTVTPGTYAPKGSDKTYPCTDVILTGTGNKFNDTIYFSPYGVKYQIADVDGRVVVFMTIEKQTTVIDHLPEETRRDIMKVQGTVPTVLQQDLSNMFSKLAILAQ